LSGRKQVSVRTSVLALACAGAVVLLAGFGSAAVASAVPVTVCAGQFGAVSSSVGADFVG